ncbi:MAG TPA: hypothetical protein VGO11_22200 [Chthoniobacteraceae bacterium]|nr:hypothetical protein [Chthoniobacteraceae bacterium]
MNEHETIRSDAAIYAALHRQVEATLQHRDESPHARWGWEQACRQFHRFDAPMLALVTREGRARIRAGDPEFVERAICYLEVDPYHFRSGYNKSTLIRCLKGLSLSPPQQMRLRGAVYHALDGHDRCEIRDFWRLASRLQTPEFIERVTERLASPEVRIQRRARQLLDYLEHFNRSDRNA